MAEIHNTLKKTLVEDGEIAYYIRNIRILQSLLPVSITDAEVRVLAAFLAVPQEFKKHPFCKEGRKFVEDSLNLSSGGLGNHLKSLKLKKLVKDELGVLSLNPILQITGEQQQEYYINIKLNKL